MSSSTVPKVMKCFFLPTDWRKSKKWPNLASIYNFVDFTGYLNENIAQA